MLTGIKRIYALLEQRPALAPILRRYRRNFHKFVPRDSSGWQMARGAIIAGLPIHVMSAKLASWRHNYIVRYYFFLPRARLKTYAAICAIPKVGGALLLTGKWIEEKTQVLRQKLNLSRQRERELSQAQELDRNSQPDQSVKSPPFQIGRDADVESCSTLAQVLQSDATNAAFAVYRRALYVGMTNVIRDVAEEYSNTMDLGEDSPVANLIEQFAGDIDLTSGYERLLRLSIAIDPRMSEPHLMLAYWLRDRRSVEEAVKHFELAASGVEMVIPGDNDPGARARAHFEIGHYYASVGEYQEASKFFEEALRLTTRNNANYSSARAEYAYALRELERYEEAGEQYLLACAFGVALPTLPDLPLSLGD